MDLISCLALFAILWLLISLPWKGTTFKLSLNSPWYEYVRDGTKSFEGRRYYGKVEAYKPGDLLEFRHHCDAKKPTIFKKVKKIYRFKSFEEGLVYFNRIGLFNKVLPKVETVEQGVEIYKKYFSLETQLRDGVAFIELS